MATATTSDQARSSLDSIGYQARTYRERLATSGDIPVWSGKTPGMPAEPLDREAFGALIDLEAGAPGFLAELVTEFQQGAVQRVGAIQKAVGAGDVEALKFAAHTLRGSCGTIGARRMATLAAQLEDAPPASPEAAWPIIHRLKAEYVAVRGALAELVPGACMA